MSHFPQLDPNIIRHHLADNPVQYDSILLAFLDEHKDITSRKNLFGHLTASAIILSPSGQRVLMIDHARHQKWLLPGGHIEADEHPRDTARREAYEEVGLTDLSLLQETIFNIDIHRIADAPQKGEPEHWHFDLRFLFHSPTETVSLDGDEAKASAWRTFPELGRFGRRLQKILL